MRRILIVDDQRYSWPKLRAELIMKGYEVVRCDSEAIAEQLIAEFQPHLVLLNLFQDSIKAWDFFIKLHDQRPELPIINYSPADMDAYGSLIEAVNEAFKYQTHMRFSLKNKKNHGIMDRPAKPIHQPDPSLYNPAFTDSISYIGLQP
jgi:DNA-binding NtrC family response regulator